MSLAGSVRPFSDPTLVVDSAVPNSVRGAIEASTLCDLLGIEFKVRRPDHLYSHGWGSKAFEAKPLISSWNLFDNDNSGKHTV